jgi:hypothetical protein
MLRPHPPAIAKSYIKTCVDSFRYKKGGKDRKKFLIDGHLPIIWGKGGHNKDLRLYLHHISPRGKPRKLIRASPSIKLARARPSGPGSRLASEEHCWLVCGNIFLPCERSCNSCGESVRGPRHTLYKYFSPTPAYLVKRGPIGHRRRRIPTV